MSGGDDPRTAGVGADLAEARADWLDEYSHWPADERFRRSHE